MHKSKPIYLCILICFSIFSLTGCLVGSMVGISEGNKNVQNQQIRYCGPDGQENWEIDKSKGGYLWGPNFDKLCGKSGIKFKKAGKTKYDPTNLSEVIIYKKIEHVKGQSTEVKKNKNPNRPYNVIGTLKFPKKWYYSSTINDNLIENMSKHGAHAILEYNSYQDSTILKKSESTNKMLNVFHMYIEAKLIRYTD